MIVEIFIFWYILYQICYQYYFNYYVKPEFKDKIIFITGGSSGIGEQLTKQLNKLNTEKIIIASRNIEEMKRVKSECQFPDNIEILKLDLNDPDQCLQFAQNYKLTNRIDILINNAGQSQRDDFLNTDFKVLESLMNINCLSPIALIKGFINLFLNQKETQIVNINSVAGLIGVPIRSYYSCSKFALDGFSKALQGELKQYNISLTNIYPAYIQTNISKNALTKNNEKFGITDKNIKNGLDCEQAVNQMIKAIYLKRHQYIVGSLFYWIAPKIMFLSESICYLSGDFIFQKQKKALQDSKKKQ